MVMLPSVTLDGMALLFYSSVSNPLCKVLNGMIVGK